MSFVIHVIVTCNQSLAKKPSFLQLEGLQKFVNHSPVAHDVQTILLLSQHPAFGISKAFIRA